jgi:hypothetical protein
MTYAKVIADSISPAGVRLTTLECEFHRYVLAEVNTHRRFSRNSASSRAIPVEKMIARLVSSPALPPEYVSNKPGMQGGEPLKPELAASCENLIRAHLGGALRLADALRDLGLHKGNTNRYLEPWMWHTAVITATDWKNFFAQRASSASLMAIREFRDFADAVMGALAASTPTKLKHGQWHLPYIDDETFDLAMSPPPVVDAIETLKKVSAARCARVSYLTQDGKKSIQDDLTLYERLSTAVPMHASPLEHVATPCECQVMYAYPPDESRGLPRPDLRFDERVVRPDHRGNFRGWDQLRHSVWSDPDDE